MSLRHRDRIPAFGAGREHGLQVIRRGDLPLMLVSGGGSKSERLGMAQDTLFKAGQLGFMTLDVYAGGISYVEAIGLDESARKTVFGLIVGPVPSPADPEPC